MYQNIDSIIAAVIILIILSMTYRFHKKFDRFVIQHGPEILTTFGIFGCFSGITLGLWFFNSSEINLSIPKLISGIKIAFFASLAGIICALSIKIRHSLTKKIIPSPDGVPKSSSIDDLVGSILQLKQSIAGDDEGTLLSQLKLIRSDTRDQFQKLINSFDVFAMKMTENNQKALIEALNQVIRDFNEKLTEQFGENFKQLNSAVGLLVTWQQQYKEELDSIKQTQLQAASDMKSASNAFNLFVQDSSEFLKTSEKLKEIIIFMNNQIEVLYLQEKALSELLSQMKNITPEFSEQIKKMIEEITKCVTRVQLESSDLLKNFDSQTTKFLEDFSLGVKKVQSETVELLKNFGIQTQSANAEMKNLLTDVLKKSQKQLSEDLQENSKIIKEGVLTLDKALQKELNDSLSSLGKQLASLSEKFVSDYLPLTERLREVVRISSNLQ